MSSEGYTYNRNPIPTQSTVFLAFLSAKAEADRRSRPPDHRAVIPINQALATVRRILNVAASEWLDEHNLTWLAAPPKIKLLKVTDARGPYPMSWDEQTRLEVARQSRTGG